MLYKLVLILFMVNTGFADIADLEKFVNELSQESVTPEPLVLPDLKAVNTNYTPINQHNLFDQNRGPFFTGQNDLKKYNLDQLQMVGFMDYKNANYAFLKTPYEVIWVKTGDKLKNASIIDISDDSVQIEQLALQDGKVYTKKILLKLNESRQKRFPKLKVQ